MKVLSRGVTIDEVWTGNWIYWTLKLVATSNYDNVTELHATKFTVPTAQIKVLSVFTRRCLAAAPNGGLSLSSGFPNCSRPH